jgi:hypothetical protein
MASLVVVLVKGITRSASTVPAPYPTPVMKSAGMLSGMIPGRPCG